MSQNYKQKYTFGADYGTSYFKFGPILCGEIPKMVENRGYFPNSDNIMHKAFGETRDIVVGEEVPLYLQAKDDLSDNLIYPMKNGVIEKNDVKAWEIVKAISSYGLEAFESSDNDFRGFNIIASLSSIAPKYMYEKLFQIYMSRE